jgi:ATP-dependent DNA helicase RecG
MISEVLLQQIAQGEDLHTEFRRDASDVDALAQVVCSFLNTQGGTVFCGVGDAGEVLGLPVHAKGAVGPAGMHQALAERLTPSALFTVSEDILDAKMVLTIEVPEGKDRPYVCDGRVFVRKGALTEPVDAEALRDMVQLKAVSAERWERRPSTAMDEADLDHDEVRALVTEASEAGRQRFDNVEDDDAVLAALGLANAKGYTQGADVLFARNPALRHPQTRVRLIRYATGKTGDAYLDDRQLQGPMVQVLLRAFEWLRTQLPMAQRFDSDPGAPLVRRARPAYPEAAVREGLVNAFAHREYASFSGGLTVSVYPDRIEIWNAGRLPEGLKPADLKRNHPSLPANPDMAQVLYLRGLMERIGRGTQKILEACADHELRQPQWDDRETGVTLTLWGPGDEQAMQPLLNARQQALLGVMKPDERLRPAEYRERFASAVSERQARRDLVLLEELGLLRVEGAGAATTYVRTGRTWAG